MIQFTHQEIGDQFGLEIIEKLKMHATPLYVTNNEEDKFRQCGSGTFVRIGTKPFILTAAHVIDELEKNHIIGFGISDDLHIYKVEVSHINFTILKSDNYSDSGPDLGLISIPPHHVGNIEAKRVFLNLDNQKILLNQNTLGNEVGVWCAIGFPERKTGECIIGNTIVIGYYGQISILSLDSSYEMGEYDYLKFSMPGNQQPDGIETYQGLSGGGVWQLIIGHKDGNLYIKDFLFKGVMFYERAEESDKREIVCHGPLSTYKFVLNQTNS